MSQGGTGARPRPLVLPSLAVVRAELDLEQGSNERRSAGLDAKAGLLLAAAGVLVGLNSTRNPWINVAVHALAAVAAAVAVSSMWPRLAGTVSPLELRRSYIHLPEAHTQLVVLDTRLALHEADESRLKRRARLFKLAAVLLASAMFAALVGSIVEAGHDGGPNDQCRQCQPVSGTSAGRGGRAATYP
jgi:hypothetical protein